ncbi:MAG: hypothetical protein MMC23_004894 [Stictis urceolatum]|nr:hypothetical protein [Stictis urceolata]
MALLAQVTLAAAALLFQGTAAQNATTCTVTAYTAVASAKASCTNIVLKDIAVPAQSVLDLTKLLTGTAVTFSGTTTFGYYPWEESLIQTSGTDIHINAEPGAVIDGNGPAWWDGQGSNGGGLKPDHFFQVSNALGNSVIEDLYIQNYPTHGIAVGGSDGLIIQRITMNNTLGNLPNNQSDGLAAGHNTDGIGVGTSSNILLRDSTILNQDDCVAVTSGDNITTRNFYCDGSHGLSIGSVGGKSSGNNVTNVYFYDSILKNASNGARIKTNYNTTGYVHNMVWSNITLENISDYGIDIQQDYLNGGPTGEPTNGVIIDGVTLENILGTVAGGGKGCYVLCGDGSCSNFVVGDVQVTGGSGDSCNYSDLCEAGA